MNKIVEVTNVIKEYGEIGSTFRALKEVSLNINKGEFVGIMGPSGSGKTTLLNIMSTIDKATLGEALIDGKRIDDYKDEDLAKFRRDTIGFCLPSF